MIIKNNSFTKKLIIISTGMILAFISILFIPMFFLGNILFDNGYEEFAPDRIYFQSYNPINPDIYFYRQDGEQEFTVVYAYLTRDGILSYKGLDLQDLFNNQSLERQNYITFSITGVTEDELKDILQSYDLTKDVPEDLEYTRQDFTQDSQQDMLDIVELRQELLEQEKDLPRECNLIESSRVGTSSSLSSYEINVFDDLTRETLDSGLTEVFEYTNGQSFGVSIPDGQGIENTMIKVLDTNYPQIKLVQLYFGEMQPDTMIQPEDTLNKVFIVLQDCTRIEVPANQDGTFDFDSALESIENTE
jgi:hypothetical protein